MENVKILPWVCRQWPPSSCAYATVNILFKRTGD